MSVAQALQEARESGLPSESPVLDAQVLLAKVLQRSRTWLLAHPDALLTHKQEAAWQAQLQQLLAGEPLPYLVGNWEFFGLHFKVTPDVLIPRPETEVLVEESITWLQSHPTRRRILDVGTGSGCIAIALAVHTPGAHVVALDLSPEALAVAQFNAAVHKVSDRLTFQHGDLLAEVTSSFDLLCANLPYIPDDLLPSLDVYAHEPRMALDGGTQGLVLIRRLLHQAPRVLLPGALLLVEIAAEQGNRARRVAQDVFPHAAINVEADLAGKPRLLRIET